jgi:hypothetical protein
MVVVKESVRMVARVDKMEHVARCSMLAEARSVAVGRCKKIQSNML